MNKTYGNFYNNRDNNETKKYVFVSYNYEFIEILILK